jgi:hypothetical protein
MGGRAFCGRFFSNFAEKSVWRATLGTAIPRMIRYVYFIILPKRDILGNIE